MFKTDLPVRVIVFYKVNIFAEIIDHTLKRLLPDYLLHITLVDSTEQLLTLLTDRCADVMITEFNYLCNPEAWGTETSRRLNMLCATRKVKRVLFVPELQHGLLRKVLQMKFELTISLQDDIKELKKTLHTLLATEAQKPIVSTYLREKGRAGARSRADLSAREWEVLHLIVEGYSLTEIARLRNRSVSTVATQKHNAMKKLNLTNHSELIKYLHMAGRLGG